MSKHKLAIGILNKEIDTLREGAIHLSRNPEYPDAPVGMRAQMIINGLAVDIAELEHTVSILEALNNEA